MGDAARLSQNVMRTVTQCYPWPACWVTARVTFGGGVRLSLVRA